MTMFEYNQNSITCPICKKSGIIENNSFKCESNHCFDISKYGYINFCTNNKHRGYSKQLYISRKNIFEYGFYNPVVDKISSKIKEYSKDTKLNIIDAGCGEGYYSRMIKQKHNANIFAFDIEKDAITMAAKSSKEITWFVGDINNIPIKNNMADILLNIFTPANYMEFFRTLKDDGIIIKLIPGEEYLKEIRDKAFIEKEKYSNENVLNHFKTNTNTLSIDRIKYELPVNESQSKDFFHMTPLTQNKNLDDNNFISKITIDTFLLVGKK